MKKNATCITVPLLQFRCFRDATLLKIYNLINDHVLTLQTMERLQASFVVRLQPSESLDTDFRVSAVWEETEEILDCLSELFSAPLIAQGRDCRRHHTDEEKSNAVGTSSQQQRCNFYAKWTQDFIDTLTHLVILIGRNLSPPWNYYVLNVHHASNQWRCQLSIHINDHWRTITCTHTHTHCSTAIFWLNQS